MRKLGLGWKTGAYLCLWFAAVLFAGAALMSLHQPFNPPDPVLAAVAGPQRAHTWRAVHVFSTSCGCSQRVMNHLAARGVVPGVQEDVVLVEGLGQELPGTAERLYRLSSEGFGIRRISASAIPPASRLRGVPLLMLMAEDGSVRYMGGYGAHGDEDETLLRDVKAGLKVTARPLVGCAVGEGLKRRLDPLGVKY